MGLFDFFRSKAPADVMPVQTLAQPQALEERTDSTTVNPQQWFLDWLYGESNVAGVAVNKESALRLSGVHACCRLRSFAVAGLQLGLYRRGKGSVVEEIDDMPEAWAVCVEPNPLYGSFSWRQANQLRVDLSGNAYNKLKFDATGRVEKITLIRGHVDPFLKDGELFYRVVHENGDTETLYASEVFHPKGLSEDGIMGKCPITVARETIGMGLAANKYASDLFDSGGMLRGFVETPGTLKTDQVRDLRNSILAAMRDYKQSGGIGVLQNNAKFNKVSLSPEDMEFVLQKKVTLQDIARFYGVPLHLIGDLDKATFSNIEHQAIEFILHTIRPIVKLWEEDLNRRILRPKDRGRYFFRFNLDSFLRGDTAARAEFYSKMFGIGAMNLDEIRGHENLNPLPDGLGQKHYVPLNMVPVDALPDASGNQQPDTQANVASSN